MPGLLIDNMEQPATPAPKAPRYGFVVSNQKVELEVDFSTQSVVGRTEITILPLQKDLHTIRIDARQCTIPLRGITVNGKAASYEYEDPMKLLEIPLHYNWSANQHDMQKERLKPLMDDDARADVALEIEIPKDVPIQDVNPFGENAASALTDRVIGAAAARNSSIATNGFNEPVSATSTMTPKTAAEQSARFQPLVVSISFSVAKFRDGLHFVGLSGGDQRFPHVYTRHSVEAGTASCIFPCVDDPAMRCTWELAIKCSRTLGDALKRQPKPHHHHHTKKLHHHSISGLLSPEDLDLNDDDKLLEMVVVCSGGMTNEVTDPDDSTKKIVSFEVGTIVAPKHIGFAIGPFEQVDLSEFREEEDEEKLGQGQSVTVSAFCLPGRADEARNICQPMAHAMDWFSLNFAGFPFPEYKMVFINDQVRDVEHTAGLSLCDIRLLCPEEIIDPEVENTRTLVHALASQWMGVTLVPNERVDRWITVGLSHFMAGMFMKILCGNNEFMFRQKMLADKLVELDINRPPLHALGEVLSLGSFEYDFMALKAPLVLFILDRRIIKEAGTQGISRVITKIALGANTGTASDSVLSTEAFRKQVEKIGKYRKTDQFWNQWILGAGCPRFVVSQKFNKKRVMIEMRISQKQDTLPTQRKLEKGEFLREFKEEVGGVFAGELQSFFTGSLTIRIHEADGTPYEHVVEIREGQGVIEIPYSTKYKRLKRSRRQKERVAAGVTGDIAEPGDDTLIYCLGDILQSQQEMQEWGLTDWNEEQQREMENESYEWFRIDADFEWLCSKTLLSMQPWMYISQLQQDRDVVAQQESMVWLKTQKAHPLAATFLIRTLMDTRYYYGIRKMAAECLALHADPIASWVGWRHLQKAFHELFCYPDSKIPRANDFSDKQAYWVSNSIPKAVSQIRHDGKCPKDARHFLLDMLRFNDNGNNEYSDNFKVAKILDALAESLLPIKKKVGDAEEMVFAADDEDEEDDEPRQFRDTVIEELDRYRRSDEWTHSYHNIYTTTVLDCKRKLMKAGVIPQDPLEFAQYLHDGTSDLVRIKAFECLIDLGLIADDAVAAFHLNALSTDPSPFVRTHLFKIFCLGLASIALDENKAAEGSRGEVDGEGDMLIVDEEASAAARKAHIARTTSIDGALAALKMELKDNLVLKEAIWKAIQSPALTLFEEYDLLDVCLVLYDPKESLVLKLRYPRFWAVEKHGKVRCICIMLKFPMLTTFLGQAGLQENRQGPDTDDASSKVETATSLARTSDKVGYRGNSRYIHQSSIRRKYIHGTAQADK
jgi:transcription initiation factor TFIID subunit 2